MLLQKLFRPKATLWSNTLRVAQICWEAYLSKSFSCKTHCFENRLCAPNVEAWKLEVCKFPSKIQFRNALECLLLASLDSKARSGISTIAHLNFKFECATFNLADGLGLTSRFSRVTVSGTVRLFRGSVSKQSAGTIRQIRIFNCFTFTCCRLGSHVHILFSLFFPVGPSKF